MRGKEEGREADKKNRQLNLFVCGLEDEGFKAQVTAALHSGIYNKRNCSNKLSLRRLRYGVQMKRPATSTQLALYCQRAGGSWGGRRWGGEGAGGGGGGRGGGSWVPYPEAKNLPSPRSSTHTRELKIPFTLTGARSWLEKAGDKKQFSTEQNHYNGPALICPPTPPPTSPLLPVPIELCHHATVICEGKALIPWMKRSSAIYSRQRFEVSGRSPAPGPYFLEYSPTLLSPLKFFRSLANFKWPAGQCRQSSGAAREEREL